MDREEGPVIYGLPYQARALAPQVAEQDAVRFLVGTQSLRSENQVHLIDFEYENIINKDIYYHRVGEIWHLSASPMDKNILATCYNETTETKSEMKAALWRIPCEFDTEAEEKTNIESLELLTHFNNDGGGDFKCVLWHPSGESSGVITIMDSQILTYDLESSGKDATMTGSANLEGKGQPKFTCGRWDPHHNCAQVATANDTSIRGWDLRSMKQVYSIENAHGQLVRDLDFNPNKQYYLASCGDDCRSKFWDIRNTKTPVKVLSDHSHWVWSVRFNHFHDQLVLTSSSDSRVILTNLSSISSEPFGALVDDEDDDEEFASDEDESFREKSKEPMQDGIIAKHEVHEHSVYAAEWSTSDPWLFASLSYDGRLLINRVPRDTKYRILL